MGSAGPGPRPRTPPPVPPTPPRPPPAPSPPPPLPSLPDTGVGGAPWRGPSAQCGGLVRGPPAPSLCPIRLRSPALARPTPLFVYPLPLLTYLRSGSGGPSSFYILLPSGGSRIGPQMNGGRPGGPRGFRPPPLPSSPPLAPPLSPPPPPPALPLFLLSPSLPLLRMAPGVSFRKTS